MGKEDNLPSSNKKRESRVYVRNMTETDIPIVRKIAEEAGIKKTVHWFGRFINKRLYCSIVAVNSRDGVVGYVFYSRHPGVLIWEIVVSQSRRRQGVASYMLRFILRVSKPFDGTETEIHARVPDTNLCTRAFLHSQKFRVSKITDDGKFIMSMILRGNNYSGGNNYCGS